MTRIAQRDSGADGYDYRRGDAVRFTGNYDLGVLAEAVNERTQRVVAVHKNVMERDFDER